MAETKNIYPRNDILGGPGLSESKNIFCFQNFYTRSFPTHLSGYKNLRTLLGQANINRVIRINFFLTQLSQTS